MQASVRLLVSEYSKLSKVQVGEEKKKKKEGITLFHKCCIKFSV